MPRSVARRRARGDERCLPFAPSPGGGGAGAAAVGGAGTASPAGGGGGAGGGGAAAGGASTATPPSAGSAAGASACAGAAGAAAGATALPPACAMIWSMFSSAGAMTAISVPTGEASPSFASRFRSIPSPRATRSMIALSVSTSARTSPVLTASPSFLSHFVRRHSSIVGESASITTLVAISSGEVHDFLHRGDCLRNVGLGCSLQILCVRHRDVFLMYAQNR